MASNSTLKPRNAGDIDTSFGNAGTTTLHVPGHPSVRTGDVTTLPDGRLLVAFSCRQDNGLIWKFGIIRLLADGGVDPTFGTDGMSLGIFQEKYGSRGHLPVPLSDGNILLNGTINNVDTNLFEPALALFSSNGQPIKAFGNNGIVKPSVGSDLILQDLFALPLENGRFLLAGGVLKKDGNLEAILIKLTQQGNLDTDFHSTGFLVVPFPIRYGGQIGSAAIGPDGKITLAIAGDGGFSTIGRLHADGKPDMSFGDSGRITLDYGDANTASTSTYKLRCLPDGGLVGAGTYFSDVKSQKTPPMRQVDGFSGQQRNASSTQDLSSGGLLFRLDQNGRPANDFNDGKLVVTPPHIWALNNVCIDDKGRFIVAGTQATEVPVVGRYLASGRLDATFGDGNGFTEVNLGAKGQILYGLEIQETKIVLSGYQHPSEGAFVYESMVRRLLG